MKHVTIKKFDGDNSLSYAVFYKADVYRYGKRNIIFYGEATPIVESLSRTSAEYYAHKFEAEEEAKMLRDIAGVTVGDASGNKL